MKKPATGKFVIALQLPVPISTVEEQALTAAAKVLGWRYETISLGETPTQAVSAFQSAIQQHPNAIIWSTDPSAEFTAEIAKASADHIALVSNSTGDDPLPAVLGDLNGQSSELLEGKIMAAYFVSQAGSKGKIALFSIKAVPIFAFYVRSFTAAVEQWCPACQVSVVYEQLADVGTTIPSDVVSEFQRDPSIKWALFLFGDMADGVVPALKQAGLSGIKLVGQAPTQGDLQDVKAGTETAWTGFSVPVLGWASLDLLARHFNGESTSPDLQWQQPTQLMTPATIGAAVLDSSNYYIGISNYEASFDALWKTAT